MKDLRSMTMEELQSLIASWGEKPFRAAQLFDWLHGKRVKSIAEMTNLPAALRERLEKDADLTTLRLHTCQVSKDGTRKYLFVLPDGERVESVYMPHDYGKSVCVSSQVGCRMGCRFCASTMDGLARNLSGGEMLEQIYRIEADTGEKIDRVVVMGMGEPLDNLENLLAFIRLLSHPKGRNLSQRHITVSTCGLVPQIRELAEEKLAITLALSLHASSDETRRRIMPIARRYTIRETLAACEEYFEKTGRRVSYEYALAGGENDREEDALALAGLLKGKKAHVNLIPVNPVSGRDYAPSEGDTVLHFQKILEKNGINATIRRKMGADIEGACGQLRRRLAE